MSYKCFGTITQSKFVNDQQKTSVKIKQKQKLQPIWVFVGIWKMQFVAVLLRKTAQAAAQNPRLKSFAVCSQIYNPPAPSDSSYWHFLWILPCIYMQFLTALCSWQIYSWTVFISCFDGCLNCTQRYYALWKFFVTFLWLVLLDNFVINRWSPFSLLSDLTLSDLHCLQQYDLCWRYTRILYRIQNCAESIQVCTNHSKRGEGHSKCILYCTKFWYFFLSKWVYHFRKPTR